MSPVLDFGRTRSIWTPWQIRFELLQKMRDLICLVIAAKANHFQFARGRRCAPSAVSRT